MIDNSRIVLEDNDCYQVIDKIKDDNKAYVYLVNTRDKDDLVVRKEIEENEERFLVGLEDEDELEKALNLYLEKNNIEK